MSLTEKIQIWLKAKLNNAANIDPKVTDCFHHLIHTADEQVIIVLHRKQLKLLAGFGDKTFCDLVRYLESEGYTVLATCT